MYLFLLWFPFKGNESQYSFLWRFLRSIWDRGIRSRSFKETMNLIETIEFSPKNFEVGSRGLDPFPRSHWNRGIRTLKRLSRFSRIRSHMQNGFSPCIRALRGIVWWKKNRGSKISWHCPFKAHSVIQWHYVPVFSVQVYLCNFLSLRTSVQSQRRIILVSGAVTIWCSGSNPYVSH
jgi:hypothetical protein